MKNIFHTLTALVIVLSIFGLTGSSFAQDGNYISNPETFQTDTSNWCDVDNIWGDGRCNTGEDDTTVWMYTAGWYWQRVTELDISPCQVPAEYGGGCQLVTEGETTTITFNTPAGPMTITIALQGSSFTGADYTVASDNFDYGTDAAGLGIDTSGDYILIIHGNGNDNIIIGSSGDDTIYGYGGNDSISGEDGDDTIYGGDESCSGRECNTDGSLGDTINGGDGDDTIYGGNETCTGNQCNLSYVGDESNMGDTIDGGDGDDTIYGGNETCSGRACNAAWGDSNMGDTIDGGAGDDIIEGGDESCSGAAYCNAADNNGASNMGDVIDGGDGADDINGGDEACTGSNCNDELAGSSSANMGDTINQNDDVNTDDGDVDTISGGTESAAAGSGDVGDSCQTSAADGDSESGC